MALFTDHYLVIDYGSSYIKGALYQTGPGGTNLLRLESLPVVSIASNEKVPINIGTNAVKAQNQLAEDVAENSNEPDLESGQSPTALLETEELGEYEYNLVRYVLSFFPEEHSYIINVPLERVYVRDITIPITNIKKIDEIIPFEVENLIPLPLEDVEIIGMPWSFEDDLAKIVSYSIDREILSEIVHPLKRHDSVIKMLSLDATGLSAFIKLLPEDVYVNKTVAQVDIGGEFTIFNVVQNGNLVFTRKIPIGGTDITQIVCEELHIAFELADQRKIELQLDLAMLNDNLEKDLSFYKKLRIEPKKYQQILEKVNFLFLELISEIERSVLSLPIEPPSIFYLSGGVVLQPGISDYLTQALEKPAKEYPVHLTNGEPAALWATTIGTGAMYRRKASERVDFLDTVFGQTLRGGELSFNMFSTPVMILLLSAVLFLISLLGSVYFDKKQIKTNLAELVKVAKTIPGVDLGSKKKYKPLINNIKQVCRTRLRSAGSGGVTDSILNLLKDISKNTPGREELNFKLKQFSYDGKSVKFEAEVKKYEDTSILIAALKKSKLFFDIKSGENRQSYNQKTIQISIQMKINKQSVAGSASCK